MSNVQKFLANEGGIHKRRFDVRPIPSATCPRESVLPIRQRPDFSVVFEGYAGGAEHWPCRREAPKRSLGADILRTCCLRGFSEFYPSV